jgi:Zn-dependent protease
MGAYAALLVVPLVLSALAGSPIWWWLGLHPLLYLAVSAHEAGHALVGWMVGFRTFEIQVGTGPVLGVARVAGTRIELRAVPICGFTAWAPTRPDGYGERLFAAVAAGPLVNLIAATLASAFLPASWALLLVGTNAWLVLGNLLPRSANDGAVLCRPQRSPEEAAAAMALAPYWEAVVRGKDGDHEGALRLAEMALARHPGWVSAQDVLAGALMGLGHYAEARQVLLDLLDTPDLPEGLWATGLLSLAEADLRSGDPGLLAEAGAAAESAARLLPWLPAARAARAQARGPLAAAG